MHYEELVAQVALKATANDELADKVVTAMLRHFALMIEAHNVFTSPVVNIKSVRRNLDGDSSLPASPMTSGRQVYGIMTIAKSRRGN